MTQGIRMVVASFLTEYLRVNWVKGCEWFHYYTLVDGDSVINAMMWQNASRSGIDQWNFVMSPVASSQDDTGEYTRKWVPELSDLPKAVLHKPWESPTAVLETAGVVLGDTYPHHVVVDLNKAERQKSADNVLAMRRQTNTSMAIEVMIRSHCQEDRTLLCIQRRNIGSMGKAILVFSRHTNNRKRNMLNHMGLVCPSS